MVIIDLPTGFSASSAVFALIALAELGDKSQLVCMTLAARYRAGPVIVGALLAFALLNALAVTFGAAVAAWLPRQATLLAVAALFAFFGVMALRQTEEAEEEATPPPTLHSALATTFLMIFLAEFGDKTQIAVAGLGSAYPPPAVWLGATLALGCTSLLGIYAGRKLLTRLPLSTIHRASGVFFLVLAAAAGYQAIQSS